MIHFKTLKKDFHRFGDKALPCLGLLTTMTFFLSLPGCGKDKPKKTDTSQGDNQTLKLSQKATSNADLETAKAEATKVQPLFKYSGDLRLPPDAYAKLVSRVEGVVRTLNAQTGDDVKKGQPLAIIESRELSDSAIAYVEASKKSHYARQAYLREKKLWEKKITAKESFLQKKEAYSQATIAYDKAIQRLKTLGVSSKDIQNRRSSKKKALSVYTVKAPLSGTILKRPVSGGEAVKHESVLYEIGTLDIIHVEFHIPAKDLSFVEKGLTATVQSENLGRKTSGRLVFISPTVDEKTRTAKARVAIKNDSRKWKPGLCAKVFLKGKPIKADVVVKNSAITEIQGKPTVFVRKSATEFHLRTVKIGIQDDEKTQILSGVRKGESVVIKNVLTLKSAWEQRGG